nr:hypothetical protein [Tanacetum cinerariifolium]
TPIDAEKPLLKDLDGEDVDVHTYRSMIVSLMYLTSSRPNIMFAVCACARFQVTPKVSHLNAVKRIFRYLKGKPLLGLWYPKDSPFDLVAYLDSDYAVIATSSTEAEYVAAASGCAQVLWMQNQLLNYGSKFYMYPHFIQLIIQAQVVDLSSHTTHYISPALTQKVFANMRSVGKGCSGVETPLFENMLQVREVDAEEEVQVSAHDDVDQENVTEEIAADVAQPTSPLPPSHVVSPSPPHQSLRASPSQAAEVAFILVQQVLDKCSALVHRVEGLESTNTAQHLEILKLKARVKKLERLNKVKTSKLRRLKKVGTSQRIESSEDEENVFNQGRISVDIVEGIELVDDQEKDAQVKGRQADTQAEIYNIDLDHTSKVLSMQEDSEVQEVVEVVNAAKLITEVATTAASIPIPAAEPVVAAVSTPISTAKPKVLKIVPAALTISTRKRKGVVIRDPEEELHDDTPAETQSAKDKGKGILVEDPKPMKKKDQIAMDAEYARKLQKEEESLAQTKDAQATDSKEEMDKEEEEIIKSKNETPAQKAAKRRRLRKQAKEAEDLKKQLKVVANEDDDVFVEATPIGTKVPIVNYEVVMINNKPRYKIFRADDTHQLYTSFITLLKNFDREDLEDLWKIIKARFSTSKPTNFTDDYLLVTLKNMFEKTDAQDVIWRSQQTEHGQALVKSWKLLTSCGVHIITFTTIMFILLVEKKYPLSRFTLEQLVNVARLQVEEENDQEKDAQVKGRQADTQAEIYNIDLDHTSKVLSMQEDSEVQEVVEVMNAAKLITEVATTTASIPIPIPAAEPVVAAVSTPISAVKRKVKRRQAEIYNIDLDHTSKVLSMQEDTEVQEVVEVVNAAKLMTKVATTAASIPIPATEPAVVAISAAKPDAKPKVLKIVPDTPAVSTRKRIGVVIRDPEKELYDDTPAETQSAKDKGKGILVEDPKPMKKKDQIAMDAEYARKLQEEEESHAQAKDVQPKYAPSKGIQYIRRYHGYKKKPESESEVRKNMIAYLKNTEGFKMAFFKGKMYDQIRLIFQARFDANMRFLLKSKEEMEKEEEDIIKSINETPAQKAVKRRRLREQAKEDENLKKQLEVVADEDDDVLIEATPIGRKVSIVNYEIVMINNKPRYKIFKADDTHQLYTSFIT